MNSPQLVSTRAVASWPLASTCSGFLNCSFLGRRLGDLLAVAGRGGGRLVVVTAAGGDEDADAGGDQERDHEDQGGAVLALHRAVRLVDARRTARPARLAIMARDGRAGERDPDPRAAHGPDAERRRRPRALALAAGPAADPGVLRPLRRRAGTSAPAPGRPTTWRRWRSPPSRSSRSPSASSTSARGPARRRSSSPASSRAPASAASTSPSG